MANFAKPFRTAVAAALMLASLTTGAQGFIGTGVNPFGVGGERGMQIKGKVVCAGCSLAEAQKAQPGRNHLYQLTNREGQVVMAVERVSNIRWWNHLTVPRLRVRGEESEFAKLSAEENLFKEVEVRGILTPAQILDVSAVTILE